MIAKLTTLAASFKSGGLNWPMDASTEYLFNTKRIKSLKVQGTTDSEFEYVFEPEDRRSSWARVRVDESNSTIVGKEAKDAPAASTASTMVALDVYEDDDVTSTPVTYYFAKDDFVFGSAYSTTQTTVWFSKGGFENTKYIVLHTLAAIVTLAEAT